jgi:putative transposase
MGRAYSNDLRERIVRAVDAGLSCRKAAVQFAVSVSCVIKLVQRWRRTGAVAPGQMGGWRDYALAGHEARVRALVARRPDLTLEELRAALAGQGIAVGRTSVWRFLLARGLTLKKRRSTPPSRSGPMSRRRARSGGRANRS